MRQQLTDATTSENSGLHVDLSADRSFLLALLDVVPPGVDEIFAVFRILDLLRRGGRVIIDMAPTGHALEVLRTPERVLAWTRVLLKTLAAHRGLPMARDAAVELATLSQNVREVAEVLRDRSRCAVVVVTLPEPLPDRETERLRSALATLEAPLASVFINRVLLPVPRSCPRCKLRGEWQALSLAKLGRQLRDTEAYIAREFGTPITGSKGLREFTSELWRLRTSAPQRKAKRQQATE